MSRVIASQISERMRQIDEQLLSALRESNDDQLTWSERPTAPSIGFHLWHIARWADRNQVLLFSDKDSSETATEVWESKMVASHWGLDSTSLGRGETGLGMSDDDATHLRLPTKSDLLDYAEETFGLLDERYAAVTDELLPQEIMDANGHSTVMAAALLSHLTHASRHLGMIEALRGMQGQSGTASA